MAIYDYKEFLTLDDLVDYLRDKGVYDFDLMESYDRYKFNNLIESFIFADKITPVFHFIGFAYDLSDENNRQFLTNKSKYKEVLIFSDIMINNWRNNSRVELEGIYQKPHSGFYPPLPNHYLHPQEIFNQKLNTNDFYKYKSFKSHAEYVLDISNHTVSVEFLVPRVELDNIFNQPTNTEQTKDGQITTLQQQLQKAQAHIKELESTQNAGVNDEEKELTANSKKAISKLLYALMAEHGYLLDGTTKGNLNDVLLNLAKKHNAEISKDTVANWLEYLNDKYYYNQKGK